MGRIISVFVTASVFLTATVALPCDGDVPCQPLFSKGVLSLDFNPAFLHVDKYDEGDGLTISSFFNAFIIPGGMPPMGFFQRDLVARIPGLDSLDFNNFNVEILTDLDWFPPSGALPRTVWPNEAVRAPDGVFPFEALVIPQGFHPAGFQGRLSVINLDDPNRQEYIVHQSTQLDSGYTYPGDPNNSPRFYHRVLFMDMNGDGRKDLVTVRSGLRVGANFYPGFSELVYFVNPGDELDPATPWQEVVLYGGPAANFSGPDISLNAYDFENDGVPEIVATHFFSGPSQMNGKISIYGAPVGGTWADVDASVFALPRVKDINDNQGLPFDVVIADLNKDGKKDLLVTNHQPDNCTPMTSSMVPGRVYAFEQPADGDIFGGEWTYHLLMDNILPNPSTEPVNPPGRMAPGHPQTFYPIRLFELFTKPWILVSGDEASKVWVLEPVDPFDPSNWNYTASVIFDINDYYGPMTTQIPMLDPFGITISTIGMPAIRYDRKSWMGLAEIYVPVFEAKEIHVFTYRPQTGQDMITCPGDTTTACPVAE